MDLKWNFEKAGGGGGGCLTGLQLLEGFTGKERVTFFHRACTFHIKNKSKSEIFNDKKGYKQKNSSLS